jgi:beta-lactamase regulating signal transducer with metallopeptidase domain
MNERLVSLVVELWLKPGLAFGLAAVVSICLHRRAASLRHRVWAAAFFVALSLPAFRLVVPPLRLPVLAPNAPGDAPAAPVTLPNGVRGARSDGRAWAGVTVVHDDGAASKSTRVDWSMYIALVWASVALALLVRLAIAYRRAYRIASRGTRPTDERLRGREVAFAGRATFAPAPELRLSRDVAAPIVVGIARPVVILPHHAARWSDADLDAALTHETAHVERWDMAFALVAQVACIVYWCNPLAWIAAAGLAREAERACDDRVVNGGAEAASYSRLLLRLATAMRAQAPVPGAAIGMARPSEVESRLIAILDPRTRREAPARWFTAAVAAAAAALAIGTAAVRLDARVPNPQDRRTLPAGTSTRPLGTEPDTRGDSVADPASERVPDRPSDARLQQALEAALRGPDSALAALLRGGLARRPSSSSDLVRERSAWALAQERGTRLVVPLLEALDSRDWRVQAYAAWALTFARNDRVDARLAPLLDHPVWRVRAMAASALHGTPDLQAQQGYLRALGDDAWQVRLAAVEHFAAFRDSMPMERIRPLLTDRHVAVRNAAASALGSR